MFIRAGELLSRVIRKSGDSQGLFAARVCQLWSEVADEIFPKANDSKATVFRGKTLTINVSSSTEAAELRLRSQVLIDELNLKIGRRVVEKLRFKVVSW